MRGAEVFELFWPQVASGGPVPGGLPTGIPADLETARLLHITGEAVGRTLGADASEQMWQELVWRIESGETPNVLPLEPRRRVTAIRSVVAVAAVLAMLVAISLRAGPGSFLYGLRRGTEQVALAVTPRNASMHLRMANARLGDLLVSLARHQYSRAPALADALMFQRSAALSGGADVRLLDARMATVLPPALESAPHYMAVILRDCLSDADPDEEFDTPGNPNNPDAEADESWIAPVQSGTSGSTGTSGSSGGSSSGSSDDYDDEGSGDSD